MKANINKTTCKELPNICAWVQFYDENANYHELFIDAVKPKDIPQPVIESFETNHDLTLYIAPGDMVGVFAKDPWDITIFVNYGCGGNVGLKKLLGEYTTDEKIQCTVHCLTKLAAYKVQTDRT